MKNGTGNGYRESIPGIVLTLLIAAGCAPPTPPLALPAETMVLRTPSPVTSVALAKTQPLMATIGQDHMLRVVSLPDGAEQQKFDLTGRTIDMFALAPTGAIVLVGDHTGRVTIWDTGTGTIRFKFTLPRYPGIAVFSRDGARLALAAQGDPVQIIDMASGRTTATLGAPAGGTLTLAFSRDGQRVVTGDGDTAIRIYDTTTGKLVAENHEFLMVPLSIEFMADGLSVVAGSGDKSLLIVDAATGKTLRKLDRTAQPVAALELSPDGASLFAGFLKSENMTEPDHAIVLDAHSLAQLADWLPPSMPAGFGWMSDGNLMVAISSPDALHLWRVR
jgi:WD40 repeat protein